MSATARWGDTWWQRAHTRHHCPAGPIHPPAPTISDTNPRQTGATAMLNVRFLKLEPVAIMYALNVAVGLLVSWGLKLSADQVGAITTIATGIITLVTAFSVRPVSLPLIKGTAATLLVAFSAFGLHLSANQVGYATAALSIVVGLLLRQSVVPASAAAKRQTAAQVYGISA